MPEKHANKAKKAADKLLRTLTNEEYDDASNRFRDRDSNRYARGPRHGDDE
ncbi:hypothetical protein [Halovivax sp.]|uniref:hypothetical protein n=1 Tax=Halovivax sp. TaxID=1935978 RepID=UPI0025C0EB28|nr:hypothetical protein [Halovivax sp.]